MVHPMMAGGVGKVPLLLLALAAGYGVLVLANKQERPLDRLGRLVGGIVLVVSFVGLLCVAVCSIMCRVSCHGERMGAACGMAKPTCPYSGNHDDASAPPAENDQAPAR